MKMICRRNYDIRNESFFKRSDLESWQILRLTYLRIISGGGSRGIERYTITDELYIGDYHTIVDCFQFCRNILVEYFNNPVQIGGVPHIVEIDDFLFVLS